MAIPFTLTARPIRITAVGFQPIYLALDVSAFDRIDLSLGVVGFEGTSPAVTTEIWTGMQNQTDDGWVQLLSFGSISGTVPTYVATFPTTRGVMRYIRWKITALTGTGTPAAVIFIRGVGRNYAGTL